MSTRSSTGGTSSRVDFRTPVGMRVYTWAFLVVWWVLLVSMGLRDLQDPSPGLLMVPVLLAAGTALCVRNGRIRAYTEGGVLVVRNALSTRRISRGQVEDVRTGSSSQFQFGEAVTVFTRDGSMTSLDATSALPFVRGGRQRLQRQREQLLAWCGRGA